jgi:hypothetical protein
LLLNGFFVITEAGAFSRRLPAAHLHCGVNSTMT